MPKHESKPEYVCHLCGLRLRGLLEFKVHQMDEHFRGRRRAMSGRFIAAPKKEGDGKADGP